MNTFNLDMCTYEGCPGIEGIFWKYQNRFGIRLFQKSKTSSI